MCFLFGTDGIRGIANKYPIDCETSVKVGRAIAEYFGSYNGCNNILIGYDTRISNHMIMNAVTSGICSMGIDVVLAGVLPTPAIAHLTCQGNFCAGVVISASHNKFNDNGIKLFDKNGCKLADSVQFDLENMILNSNLKNKSQNIQYVGRLSLHKTKIEEYNYFLENSYSSFPIIRKMKIILDCSNGATSECAPIIFNKLGAEVSIISGVPDGININDNCGSEYPDTLAKIVLERGADIGLAFDGDGDRLTVVSELGEILNGDQLLAIFANFMKKIGSLRNNTVVSSIMSNFGLDIALKKLGVKHIKSKVGDKYVAEKMVETGASLGGENSGHIIFGDYQKTGDALLAGLQLIGVIKKSNKPLSKLAEIITLSPQSLVNIDVSSRPEFSTIPDLQNAIVKISKKLADTGRVLVRYSGTQPKCRIMVEGNDLKRVTEYSKYISSIISKHLST